MIVFGIDPGPLQSAYAVWDGIAVMEAKLLSNLDMILTIRAMDPSTIYAIEVVRGYGQIVGNDTFFTAEWVGRFDAVANFKAVLLPRKDIKLHLCGNTSSRDSDIRKALIDRIGPQGTKKAPGPTFGLSGHTWAALAVAVVAYDRK